MIRRLRTTIVGATTLAALAMGVAVAAPAQARSLTTAPATAAAAGLLPTTLALPDGFQPEGIAIGHAPFAFFGSRVDGDLFRVNLITGVGTVFSQGPGAGHPSLGMKVDMFGRLFVAGGTGGDGRVVNAVTGEVLASYTFAAAPTFVNDVILTRDAAWFTDSLRPVIYRVPFDRGRLPAQSAVTAIPLTGDYVHQPGLNANGIARTPDGTGLIIVQTATGLLFRVDPATGVTTRIDLGGTLLPNGDGLLQRGRTLFVVQNLNNQVSVVSLNAAGTAGQVTQVVTDPRFDTPTTAASFGNRLYIVNARFTTPPTATTPYTAVAIRRP